MTGVVLHPWEQDRAAAAPPTGRSGLSDFPSRQDFGRPVFHLVEDSILATRQAITKLNRDFVQEMLASKKRLEDYPERVDPDLVIHEPASLPFGGTYHGMAEFSGFYDRVREYYDFSTWRLGEVIAAGDVVVSTSEVRIADRAATMHIMERFRFDGDKLVEVRVYTCEAAAGCL